MNLAPIVLFAYNRPSHTLRTLEALAENELANDSILYVFADGTKKNASEEDIRKLNDTRSIIKNKQWCKEVVVYERTENYGLAKSIITGVTEIVNKHGKVIVLEDDLVTSKYFLKYMNDALNLYEKENSVACISAYIYPVDKLPELFFIKGADCWGWATWKRSWDLFEHDGKKLMKELKSRKLTSLFDFNNTYPYTKMLDEQIKGINNSWAIRWYASAFLHDKLCLYPGKSLVNNIGMDGSGTHCDTTDIYDVVPLNQSITFNNVKPIVNTDAVKKISEYFVKLHPKKSKLYTAKQSIKKILPPVFISLYRKLKN